MLFFLFLCLISCKKEDEEKNVHKNLIVGFSQIGAESAWRVCHTRSMLQAANSNSIQLLYENAEQKQENQIKALRSFIAYQVDAIVFVPIVQDGWDNVLIEAKEAGIPVIVCDRKITTSDDSLFECYVGTNSLEEGRKAANFLIEKYKNTQQKINIFEMRGTDGSSAAEGRYDGFRQLLNKHDKFEIIKSESGDFLRSRGKELMHQVLKELEQENRMIDVIFSHNDSMTLGIIEALEENHIRPGKDITIITIDAEQAAIDALNMGKVNFVIECNPHLGPKVMELILDISNGVEVPKLTYIEETSFSQDIDFTKIEPRDY